MAADARWEARLDADQAIASLIKLQDEALEASRVLARFGKQGQDATKKVTQGAEKTTKAATKTRSELGRWADEANRLRWRIRGVTFVIGAATAATLGYARALVLATDRASNMRTQLRVLANTNKTLKFSLEELTTVANNTFSSVAATQSLVSRTGRALSSSGLDVTKDQLTAFTTAINQAAIVSGASATESGSAIYQLTQALASGRFAGDELRSVLEGLPRLAEAIAKGLGVSVGELRKMGSEGKLGPLEVMNAILTQTKALNEEFALVEVTTDRWTQNLNNNLTLVLESLGRSTGITKTWRAVIQGAAEAAGELAKRLQAAAIYRASGVDAPESRSSFAQDLWENAVLGGRGQERVHSGGDRPGTVPIDKAIQAEVRLHTEMAKIVTEAQKLPKEGRAALVAYNLLEKKFQDIAGLRDNLGFLISPDHIPEFSAQRAYLADLELPDRPTVEEDARVEAVTKTLTKEEKLVKATKERIGLLRDQVYMQQAFNEQMDAYLADLQEEANAFANVLGKSMSEMDERMKAESERLQQQASSLEWELGTPAEQYEMWKQSTIDAIEEVKTEIGQSGVDELLRKMNERIAEDARRTWEGIGQTIAGTLRGIGESTEATIQAFFRLLANWKNIQEQIDIGKTQSGGGITGQGIAGLASSLIGALGSFDKGGVVPGAYGAPQLAIVHGGEEVIPANQRGQQGNTFNVSFQVMGDFDMAAARFVTSNPELFANVTSEGLRRTGRLPV